MQTASWPPIVSGLTRPGPGRGAGEPCSTEPGAQTVAGGGTEAGAEIEAGTQAGAGSKAQLWRGQSEGNHRVLQEPPNGSIWLSPLLDRDVGSKEEELPEFRIRTRHLPSLL